MNSTTTAADPELLDPAAHQPTLISGQPPFALSMDDVLRGDVAVVRHGLQTLKLFDRIVDTTLEQAGTVVSEGARAALADRGFERMHEAMSAREAFRLRYALSDCFTDLPVALIHGFVDALAQPPRDVYVCTDMYVRIMMPEDVVATERELLAEEFGHMIVHAPHRDSWFSHCTNTINLWAAVGPVRPGNGMLVYPQARHDRPRRVGTHIDLSTRLGRPMNFTLEPGDILVFNGEHIHSSEVNITDETRYVVTVRLTVGAPRYADGIGWVPYHRLSMLDGPLRRFATVRSRLTASRFRQLVRRGRARIAILARRNGDEKGQL